MSLPVLIRIVSCLHVSLDYLIFGKYHCADPAVKENQDDYIHAGMEELNELLKKCSPTELELIKKLIKTILPYINMRIRLPKHLPYESPGFHIMSAAGVEAVTKHHSIKKRPLRPFFVF